MELKNFDAILERVPKMSRPMRVILAGSDGENMLKGIFAAQENGPCAACAGWATAPAP